MEHGRELQKAQAVQATLEIEGLFAHFAAAVASGDVQSYRRLVNGPDPFQEDLFLRNSLRLRELRLHMQLRRIERDGDTACLYFDLLDADQRVREQGSLTVVQAPHGWLIEEL